MPHFESRWLQRSKHPYTAKSSALVIRHAVSIDERRAKFRQDLLSEKKPRDSGSHGSTSEENRLGIPGQGNAEKEEDEFLHTRYRRPSRRPRSREESRERSRERSVNHRASYESNISPNRSVGMPSQEDLRSRTASTCSLPRRPRQFDEDDFSDDEADEERDQDIQEIWFPGCHADIGAGWPLEHGEEIPLSHGPLVWMVREAQKAGLRFDQQKVEEMKCGGNMGYEDEEGFEGALPGTELRGSIIPQVHITTTGSPTTSRTPTGVPATGQSRRSKLHKHLHMGATQGFMHDVLEFKNGTPRSGVIAWNIMEHLPFRRMDLQADGSWRSIRWPLPMGEVRDIPDEAVIHNSAIRRMEANKKYRPGNLVVGGGGRGVRVAPEKYGIGEWEVYREKGDPVGECYVRKKPAHPDQHQSNGKTNGTTNGNTNGATNGKTNGTTNGKSNGTTQATDFEKF